ELAEYRKGYEQRFRRALSSDSATAGGLLADLRFGRQFTWRRQQLDAALALSGPQLQEALRRHLGSLPFIDMVARDVSTFHRRPRPRRAPGRRRRRRPSGREARREPRPRRSDHRHQLSRAARPPAAPRYSVSEPGQRITRGSVLGGGV